MVASKEGSSAGDSSIIVLTTTMPIVTTTTTLMLMLENEVIDCYRQRLNPSLSLPVPNAACAKVEFYTLLDLVF